MDFSQNPSLDLGGSGKAKNNPIISIKLSYVWIIDSSEYLGGVGRALMNQSKQFFFFSGSGRIFFKVVVLCSFDWQYKEPPATGTQMDFDTRK